MAKKKTVRKSTNKTSKTVKTGVKKKIVKKGTVKKKEVKKTAPKKAKAVVKTKVPVKKSVAPKTVVKKVGKPIRLKKKEEDTYITPEVAAANRAAALKKIKGYNKKELEQFREIILDKRDEILEQLQNLKDQMLDPATGEYINENSPYSLHMAEQGTDAMEREKTFLYAQRENKFLGYLEDALKRIDNGTYGICLECIEEPQHLCPTCPLIPKARLEAVPHSQLCLPMKQRQEKK
jgi:DnaK suppressor protein